MPTIRDIPFDDVSQLLSCMWEDYARLNPIARRIHALLNERGELVINDHIGLRTFDLPEVSIEVLAQPFLAAGYVEKDQYEFPEKKVVARHYESTRGDAPKIFLSQIRVRELPRETGTLVRRLLAAMDPGLFGRSDVWVAGRPWPLAYADYESLRRVSDYAAWVAAFGFRPNHFTIDAGALRTFTSLAELNSFLKKAGFILNGEGGEIKGSPKELLEQSSTVANLVDVEFSDGLHRIPAGYYEFARRYKRPDGRLFQGFIAASAERIFESTSRGQ